ncbi:MAG TPA: type II secretion system protein, partial [Pirellulaceae bacterium]|nr:type II secretion system protein [Pirellulaceae bacterium]
MVPAAAVGRRLASLSSWGGRAMDRTKSFRSRAGFTLVELLVVIAIIGV